MWRVVVHDPSRPCRVDQPEGWSLALWPVSDTELSVLSTTAWKYISLAFNDRSCGKWSS